MNHNLRALPLLAAAALFAGCGTNEDDFLILGEVPDVAAAPAALAIPADFPDFEIGRASFAGGAVEAVLFAVPPEIIEQAASTNQSNGLSTNPRAQPPESTQAQSDVALVLRVTYAGDSLGGSAAGEGMPYLRAAIAVTHDVSGDVLTRAMPRVIEVERGYHYRTNMVLPGDDLAETYTCAVTLRGQRAYGLSDQDGDGNVTTADVTDHDLENEIVLRADLSGFAPNTPAAEAFAGAFGGSLIIRSLPGVVVTDPGTGGGGGGFEPAPSPYGGS